MNDKEDKGTAAFVDAKFITNRYGISRDCLHRWVRHDLFPRGVHFGKMHRWALSELIAWEQQQAEAEASRVSLSPRQRNALKAQRG